MAVGTAALVGGLFDIGGKVIDRMFPDPEEKARAKQELTKLEQEGELEQMSVRLSAILAEAKSDDPWTSRARPSFMYVFYLVILSLVIVAPLVGVIYPEQMILFFDNVSKGFTAIPEELWATFTAGYLGYGAMRSYDKKKVGGR